MNVFEIHARWVEEVDLLKQELSTFVKHYTEVHIPSLKGESQRAKRGDQNPR